MRPVMVGLPDTVWFPADAFRALPRDVLSFLLFPVAEPRHFDAVITDTDDFVVEIQVKQPEPASSWIWGAFQMPGYVFHELHALWRERGETDEYIGTLVNDIWRAEARRERCEQVNRIWMSGRLHGYREALKALELAHA